MKTSISCARITVWTRCSGRTSAFLDIMYEWADGGSLGSCLYGTDMTGGDFVRTAKRLADVLQQIAVAQPLPFDGESGWQALAHEAADRVNRGVVAYLAWTDGGRLMEFVSRRRKLLE